MSTEFARDRPDIPGIPGIQLLRFEGVLGRESGAEPGMANPAELAGLLNSRPLLRGRLSTGELGVLWARSWFTESSDGGGGRLSRSKRSMGDAFGIVRGSEKTVFGVETWRVGRELLRRRRSWEISEGGKPGEPGPF